jgi:hypothetical protein
MLPNAAGYENRATALLKPWLETTEQYFGFAGVLSRMAGALSQCWVYDFMDVRRWKQELKVGACSRRLS